MPRTWLGDTGTGSAVGLASPLVVIVPSGLTAITRWLLTWAGQGRVGEDRDVAEQGLRVVVR